MAKGDFVWDYEAAGQLFLKSSEIADVCEKEAERMTRATGMSYKSDVFTGKTRVNARGYQQGENGEESVCPKCGHSHPNCNCNAS